MVIFRENTEDIYAGIEYAEGSAEVKKVIQFLQQEMGANKIRFLKLPVSASSQFPPKVPNVWFVQRFNTQSITTVKCYWYTKATS